MRRYAFHPEASVDLSEIANYIAFDNPDAALHVVDEIHTTLESLARFPHQGHKRPDLTSRPLRFKVVRNYLIAYAPEEKPLWIVAIFHGHRNPRTMAAILRSRD
jgi:toxin ParE1/3/4